MLDPYITPAIQVFLRHLAKPLVARNIRANTITVVGFFIGLLAVPALAFEYYSLALCFILTNRFADGLDGAVARLTRLSDSGGFLDIVLDFVFYAAIVLGFALARVESNALAACWLMFSFMATGSSFLAFATMAHKNALENPQYPHKSLYYMQGLVEGSETIVFFILCCLFPDHFPILALGFASLCFVSATVRIIGGYQILEKSGRVGG